MKDCSKRNKAHALLMTAGLILFLSLSVAFALIFSENYQKIYKTAANINGVMDLSGYSVRDVSIDFTASGKWEFFYNKWIVTDNIDSKPDFLIDVPGRWTGNAVNGKRLGNSGYASYRFTILNPEPDSALIVKLQAIPIAYRVFINSQQVIVSGTLSKTPQGGFANGFISRSTPYAVTDSTPLEVVLELSYNTKGGLFLSPWLHDGTRNEPAVWSILALVPVVAIALMAALVIFNLILHIGLYRNNKNLSFALLLVSFFIHLFTTKEVYCQLGRFLPTGGLLSYALIFELNIITAFFIFASFMLNVISQKTIALFKKEWYIFFAAAAVCAVCFYMLTGTVFQIIPVSIGIFCICGIFYKILRTHQARQRNKYFPAITLGLIMFAFLMEALDSFGLVVFGVEPGFSIMTFILIIITSVASFLKIRDSSADLLKAAVLEKEVQQVKHQALKAQIKPHFIFNVLSSIQALYRKDAKAGEDALTDFAQHLRHNIDADNKDAIPFQQEIKNILNYVELENLRLSKPVQLLLDIEYSDFDIPVLSLQPLIENAIKHAGLDNIEDGYIRLKSSLTDGFVTIRIIDNGCGFDIDKIRDNAAGLKNSKERFKYLLGADVVVESKIGAGTVITIKIPQEKKDIKEKEQQT